MTSFSGVVDHWARWWGPELRTKKLLASRHSTHPVLSLSIIFVKCVSISTYHYVIHLPNDGFERSLIWYMWRLCHHVPSKPVLWVFLSSLCALNNSRFLCRQKLRVLLYSPSSWRAHFLFPASVWSNHTISVQNDNVRALSKNTFRLNWFHQFHRKSYSGVL